MNALEIKGLQKEYGDFALSIDELVLPQGCIMGLVGENGAGKTTLIKSMLGLIRADEGGVSIADGKENLGVVLDEVGIPGLNARETGKVMAGIFPNWNAERFASLLRQLKVPENKGFEELSRGMKMKLGIAVAMSHGAKLLILDEATNGLDPVARDEVLELLWEFTREEDHSVLISSHIVSDLEKVCDYIVFLHEGRVLLAEEKDRLTENYGVLRCPAERLAELDESAVLARRSTGFGAEAIVRRSGVPAGAELGAVSIEDIFVAMVKGE
ncbi:MAG: ABC transporter ATP-binding protein [Oscillospiraceae bacterium]